MARVSYYNSANILIYALLELWLLHMVVNWHVFTFCTGIYDICLLAFIALSIHCMWTYLFHCTPNHSILAFSLHRPSYMAT